LKERWGASKFAGLAIALAAVIGASWAASGQYDRLRWACAAVLGLLWLWIAARNARAAWRGLVRREKNVPSMTLFIGGLAGLLAVHAVPRQWDAYKWPLRLAALFLDAGSAPFVLVGAAMIAVGLIRGKR
jgi:hypothetical protein